ncbi:hypothetical protein STAQ_29590 [Allostella sp. ATCC 35155]|nr:hypothetical protein STAQ_29590 [Stella sp. ATCC 35155]
MPPLDLAPHEDAQVALPSSPVFTFEEIGWIGDLAIAIALRRGADRLALSAGGVVVADAHRDAEPLLRLARDRRLAGPACRLLGGDAIVVTSLLCFGVGLPAGFLVPDAVLATVWLDRRPSPSLPGAAYGRFGTVAVRRLSDKSAGEPGGEPAGQEARGDSFRVVYVAAGAVARWPKAGPADAAADGGLWPSAHMAFG